MITPLGIPGLSPSDKHRDEHNGLKYPDMAVEGQGGGGCGLGCAVSRFRNLKDPIFYQ